MAAPLPVANSLSQICRAFARTERPAAILALRRGGKASGFAAARG